MKGLRRRRKRRYGRGFGTVGMGGGRWMEILMGGLKGVNTYYCFLFDNRMNAESVKKSNVPCGIF